MKAVLTAFLMGFVLSSSAHSLCLVTPLGQYCEHEYQSDPMSASAFAPPFCGRLRGNVLVDVNKGTVIDDDVTTGELAPYQGFYICACLGTGYLDRGVLHARNVSQIIIPKRPFGYRHSPVEQCGFR